jgi:hypothetical protein
MRKILVTLGALAAVAAGLLASGALSAGGTAVAAPSSGISAAAAEQIARSWAERAGESAPQVAVQSENLSEASTAMHAGDAVSAAASPTTPVYLVTMHGHFTLGDTPTPRGYTAPSGSVMNIAVGTGGFVYAIHVGAEE